MKYYMYTALQSKYMYIHSFVVFSTVHMHTYTHTHTDTLIHTHTHTHTHTHFISKAIFLKTITQNTI